MKDLPKPVIGILIFALLVVIALSIYWGFVVKARFSGIVTDSYDILLSGSVISSYLS